MIIQNTPVSLLLSNTDQYLIKLFRGLLRLIKHKFSNKSDNSKIVLHDTAWQTIKIPLIYIQILSLSYCFINDTLIFCGTSEPPNGATEEQSEILNSVNSSLFLFC
jgi:hypothetical protein